MNPIDLVVCACGARVNSTLESVACQLETFKEIVFFLVFLPVSACDISDVKLTTAPGDAIENWFGYCVTKKERKKTLLLPHDDVCNVWGRAVYANVWHNTRVYHVIETNMLISNAAQQQLNAPRRSYLILSDAIVVVDVVVIVDVCCFYFSVSQSLCAPFRRINPKKTFHLSLFMFNLHIDYYNLK